MNCVLLIFIHVFGQTASIEPKSVNLALDTILEFNNKDNTDLQIIDNVQEFLEKIKNILKYNSGRRSLNKDFKFTDFLIDFLKLIVNNYDDDDLEDVVTVISDEIRKYHYAGCRFFELLQNNDMRKFFGRKLDQIKAKSPNDMRLDMRNIVNALKTQENRNVKEFIQYINTLYPKDSKDNLTKFLNNIELYKSKSKRANLDLIKVIREGLRNSIFDHYTGLNVNARKDFKIRLETFWKNFMDPYKFEHKVWNLRYTKFDKRGRDETTSIVSAVNREFNDQTANVEGLKDIGDFKFNTLKYFDRIMDYTTKPTEIEKELKHDTRNIYNEQFTTEIEVTTQITDLKSNLNIFSTVKDVLSQIKFIPIKQKEIKYIDKSIFSQFNDDVTSKNIVKEFEKSIDFNLPDIPKMVKQKFNSITKERLMKDNNIVKDIEVDIHKTSKKPYEKVKTHKPKIKNKYKHATPRYSNRYSIVTKENTVKSDNFYDSEEIYNIHRKKTKRTKKRKPITTTKRKHKKDTKITTKSRFMTLFVEEYTGKVKKIRTRDKTTPKPKQYTSWKEVKKHRSKHKKLKTKRNRYTFAGSDESIKSTTRAKEYKDHRQEKLRNRHKKHKTQKKYLKRSEKATKKSRKWLKLPTTASYEGISIESFEERSYRKNIDIDDFLNHTTDVDKIINITNSISATTKATTVSERIESPTIIERTFGPLDFWQGTTEVGKSISHKSTILPNATKTTENTTIMITTVALKPALRIFKSNNTFEKESYEELLKNDTIRLIELNDVTLSTKLPIINKTDSFTKTTETKANTVNTTKFPQKPTIKKPLLKRRIIENTTKYKINTTSKKTTTGTKMTVTTRNSTISGNVTKLTFNLGHFLNQSEVLNVEDNDKKDKIKEKMLKDMQSIFSPTTTTSTTEGSMFTDPFNEIENVLDLD